MSWFLGQKVFCFLYIRHQMWCPMNTCHLQWTSTLKEVQSFNKNQVGLAAIPAAFWPPILMISESPRSNNDDQHVLGWEKGGNKPYTVTFKESLKTKCSTQTSVEGHFTHTTHTNQNFFPPHFFYSPWCSCDTWPFVITSECLHNLGLQKLLLLSRCLCNPTPRSQTAASRHPRPSLLSYRVKTGHFLH